jgi:hypothetical protein
LGKPKAHLLREHRQKVEEALQLLKERNLEEGKDITELIVRPIPDIIEINWAERRVGAIEVSKSNQSYEKRKIYADTEWAPIELIRFNEKKERTVYTSVNLRYRRIF